MTPPERPRVSLHPGTERDGARWRPVVVAREIATGDLLGRWNSMFSYDARDGALIRAVEYAQSWQHTFDIAQGLGTAAVVPAAMLRLVA